jgi:hypothetical protein
MATDALTNDAIEPLPVELLPNVDHLVTEDETPVDNVFSKKQQRLLTEPLYSSWSPGRPFVAMANVRLGLQIWNGRYEDHENTWLRWVDAEGRLVPTGSERADLEQQRPDQLAAQLRRLGVEPKGAES